MSVAQIGLKPRPPYKRFVWAPILRFSSFLFHPISVFVVLQLVSITITVLWVIWYVNQNSVRFSTHYDLAFLITGCILCGIILIGTVLLFVFALKQLRLNNQQKSFVSSVTHELRSPIASVQLSLDTLQHRTLDEDTTNHVFQMMQSDMDRLVNLVDQILVSARLDRGIKIFDDIGVFNLGEVLEEAASNAAHLDPRLRERLVIDCPSEIELSTARPAVTLIFNNLLENAVKYSPDGSLIKIRVEPGHDHVLIKVQDNGFGLEKHETKRIFKIFARGDLASKKAISGTGLGLYIVNAVLKVLGGKVWAESLGKGLGSTFFVYLPVEQTYTKIG